MVSLLFLFLCLQLYSKHSVALEPQCCGGSEETLLTVGFLGHAAAEYGHCNRALSLDGFTLLPITSLKLMELVMTSKDVRVTKIISQFLISSLSHDHAKAPQHYFILIMASFHHYIEMRTFKEVRCLT